MAEPDAKQPPAPDEEPAGGTGPSRGYAIALIVWMVAFFGLFLQLLMDLLLGLFSR